MRLSKRLFGHPRTQSALSWVFASFIRVVVFTSRTIRHIDTAAQIYVEGRENAIFAFWHGRMMVLPPFCPKRKTHILISLHRDGKLISQVISRFNHGTVSGSSSKGGGDAVNEILQVLEAGDNVGITPDGPRGPLQVASIGIARIARIAQKPVVPVAFASTRHRRWKSWDRLMLALPFGRIELFVGAPIRVALDADETRLEAARMQIEQAMNQLVAKADAAVGA